MFGSLFSRVLELSPVMAVIVGALVFIVLQQLKRFWTFLDTAPAWMKQGTSVALAAAFVGLAHLIPGFHAPESCAAEAAGQACRDAVTNKDFLTPILAAIVSALIHAGKKAQEKSA